MIFFIGGLCLLLIIEYEFRYLDVLQDNVQVVYEEVGLEDIVYVFCVLLEFIGVNCGLVEVCVVC